MQTLREEVIATFSKNYTSKNALVNSIFYCFSGMVRNLNVPFPDPDSHSYEGEFEAVIVGIETTRMIILKELEK